MKRDVYLPPQAELFELDPRCVICDGSDNSRTMTYGDEGMAGGAIDNDNYVNGGDF
ncbi:MAG: hypothetical protein IKX71_07310 [Bacteroidales bacterium]|nr:hypothetical protein [Bacteroidales bacterium]